MSNEEAIEVIEQDIPCEHDTDLIEALEIAIKALEQESCHDAISRQSVIDYIHRILNQGTGKKKSFEFIQKYVEKLPPIQPQPKTGHWIWELEDWNKWICSECGWSKRTDVHVRLGYNFCPVCGAKMIQESEES